MLQLPTATTVRLGEDASLHIRIGTLIQKLLCYGVALGCKV